MSSRPDDAARRLVVYGSLAPGESAHHLLAGLRGSWERVNIRGRIVERAGYPVFTPDELGELVSAWMLESPELPGHWPVLDAYEGDGYVRRVIDLKRDGKPVPATIYMGA